MASFGVEDIPALVAAAVELVRLIKQIQEQSGLSEQELWQRASEKTQANATELREFIAALGG